MSRQRVTREPARERCYALTIFPGKPDLSVLCGARDIVPLAGAFVSASDRDFIERHFERHMLIVFIAPNGATLTDEQAIHARRAARRGIPFIVLPQAVCTPE